MRRTINLSIFYFFLIFFHLSPLSAQSRETVFVSILPQKLFVQHISGDSLDIEVMVQPGASPATYEPKPSQMKKLSASALYFAIGVPFERAWLDKIADINPNMKIIHTEEGIARVAMEQHHARKNSIEEVSDTDEDHDHEGLDPHIWLSPVLVKKQTDTMRRALIELFPDKSSLYNTNFDQFMKKIDNLHHELQTLLQDKKGMKFMVFHPSWGYFAREYGLEQIAIEIEGKSPKPAQMKELIEYARSNAIQVIFAQKQFSTKNAEIIAREIQGEVIQIDPLAEDWLSNMITVAHHFKSAVK